MTETDEAWHPVFVVGSSRSGTGLMRLCLNGHPRIHLARETHYFDDLRRRLPRRRRAVLDARDRVRCEDYFLALDQGSYHVRGGLGEDPAAREELRVLALRLGLGADAVFEAFCRLQARARGKSRWGEKTPRHVFRIEELLGCYPEGQVICLLRDPRAVVASYRDRTDRADRRSPQDPARRAALARELARQRRSADPLLNSLMWRSSVRAARQALARFGPRRVRLQRYEDLVARPEATLRDLAEWLGVGFSPSMLDVPVRNTSYASTRGGHGIVTQPSQRWREMLGPGEVAVVQSACRRIMEQEGYRAARVGRRPAAVARGWLRLPVVTGSAALANRARSGGLPAYVWARFRHAVEPQR